MAQRGSGSIWGWFTYRRERVWAVVTDNSNQSFLWDTRTNPVTKTSLGPLGGGFTFARDINDLGEAVGSSRNAAEQ